MEEEIKEQYEKIKDKITEEEFYKRIQKLREENVSPYSNDLTFANQVVGQFETKSNDPISESEQKIGDIEPGSNKLNVIGRVMNISNPKKFITRNGKEGKLCNIEIEDDTARVRVVLWRENIKLLKNVHEGEIVKLGNVEAKKGFRGGIELNLQPRSTITHVDEHDYSNFPKYQEIITPLKDIVSEEKVNVIGRIIRISNIRTFEKNGKEGKVTSFEIQDATGKKDYTLWNNDVDLIESLELKEGYAVKILSAQARERDGKISLNHWDSRIIKGDYDVPDFEENFIKIADAHDQKDVSLMGIVTKIQDPFTFTRTDGSEGKVKSIEIKDDTGDIRVTLWNDNTSLDINKGSILKIIGGDVEFDDYAPTGHKINTSWKTRFIINPEDDDPLIDELKEYQSQIRPLQIEEIQEIDDDGVDVDVIGRILSSSDVNEFQRDDGSLGLVRSVNLADETGIIQLSLWDEKAKENFSPGDPYKIENGRTKMGMYAVDLNIGRTSRIIKLSDEEATLLPSFETLEKLLYTPKKIMDLDDDDRNIVVVGRIFEVYEVHEFERDNGDKGLVRNIEIADNTGSIRVTLWDSDANRHFEVGEAIKLENPRIIFRDDHLEISISRNTLILTPSESDLETLPSADELFDIVYKEKTIETLEEDDTNVRLTGVLNDASGNKILITKCPHCNNTVDQTEDEFVCDFCGEEIDKPKYLLMIPGRFEDETGEISITFFGKLAEDLLEMDLEEIIAIIEDSGDLGALEGKIEDLNGLNIEIIANVNFDEYNEEIRLSPKKILSKYY